MTSQRPNNYFKTFMENNSNHWKRKFLAVGRERTFSPGRVVDDEAILTAVAWELERRGHDVLFVSSDELTERGIPEEIDGIFQMVRSAQALSILEQAVVPVTNCVKAVHNCGRSAQTALLYNTGLIPKSVIHATHELPTDWNCYPCWVKRGDSHAILPDDVRFVGTEAELKTALASLHTKGVGDCVIQEHIKGWVIKFYGVKGAGLTGCFAVQAEESKFGLEIHNERPSGYLNRALLADMAEQAAQTLGVEVYGGDAIVSPDGQLSIVDMNDWPSFRRCVTQSATAIADLIINKVIRT